jgi:6,7-dimethyl-8-ribityllumazine synthase
MQTIEAEINVTGKKFAIILSRFNEFVGTQLLEGALDCLKKQGVNEKDIILIKVPGAFEIPITAKKLAESRKYSAIICLGAIIKGGTPHFEYVAGAAVTGIQQISLEFGIPVILGVLTTNTIEQALERASTSKLNKGWDAAMTAIEMADILDKINNKN